MPRGDFAARDSRVRDPVKGLRQRLRIALREAGVTAKFRTDHGRNFEGRFAFKGVAGGFLVVMSKENINLPFDRFEDFPVVFMFRRKT